MAAQVVAQGSALAQQLQNIVQPKLVETGWSSDDTTLSEYIVLMLANGKDKEQVANELAKDLLGLEDGDTSAADFSEWLFGQLAVLNGQAPTEATAPVQTELQTQAIQSIPTGPSADNDSGMEVEQTQGIPTGPKALRKGSGPSNRGNDRRSLNPMNKAISRTADSVLHKVRNNSTERIGRGPPRGPRGGMHGGQFNVSAGAGRGGPRNQQQISSQQQNQLMQFMSQQMEMMQQVLQGQNPQAMMNGMNPMNGMNGAAINPHFRGRPANDRGGRGGGKLNDRKQHHQNGAQASQAADIDMTGDAMETESAAGQPRQSPADTICKFNSKCTKSDCPFVHQSPAAPPNTTIDMGVTCEFSASCKNHKCVGKHPSPAQRTAFQAGQECKFWPNCTNAHCQFKHPDMPLCKFGGDCNRDDCKFSHVRTMCKYNPCMNPKCHFKHAEGQKKSPTWTKDGGDTQMSGEHVSERKFTSGDGGEEELIKPAAPQEDVDVAT